MVAEEIFILCVAVIGGGLPPLLWLWFWLNEETHHEPKLLILGTFVGGMMAVPIAFYFEKFLANYTHIGLLLGTATGLKLFFAFIPIVFIEEIVKYGAAALIAFRSRHYREPIDTLIYIITATLGFSALENVLFLLGNVSDSIITLTFYNSVRDWAAPVGVALAGNSLRFIGAAVLHVVTSGFLGFFIGMAFYKKQSTKILYFVVGLSTAVLLHALFNFFILEAGENPLKIFPFLWAGAILLILLFEEIKRIK